LEQEMTVLDQRTSGELTNLIMSDTEAISKTISLISELTSHLVLVLILLSYLFYLDSTSAVIIIISIPIIIIIALSFRRYARQI